MSVCSAHVVTQSVAVVGIHACAQCLASYKSVYANSFALGAMFIVNDGSAAEPAPAVARQALQTDNDKLTMKLKRSELYDLREAVRHALVNLRNTAQCSKELGIISAGGSYMKKVDELTPKFEALSLMLERASR